MSELRATAWRLAALLADWLQDGFRRERAGLGEAGSEAAGAPASGAPASEAFPGAAAPAAAEGPPGSAPDSLEAITREVMACSLCGLHRGRHRAVPGEGVSEPLVIVVGEGPGADEDRTGRPFVGRAGQYLDKWLAAIGLDRAKNCYIANVVKCRPPGNRDPLPEESAACGPYLKRQIALLRPRAVLTLGRVSSQILTGRSEGIGGLRGRRHELDGLPLIATYHPSAVLRDTTLRAAVWEDLKLLRTVLREQGIALPG